MVSLGGAQRLLAQSVQGRLVDKTNGSGIAGAFVVLVDQRGQEVARGLTGDAGKFLLRAPGPGTYRIQSKRIGFRVAASPPLSLTDGQVLTYRLAVEEIPAELPPVVVEGRPECGSSGGEGTVLAQLWEDAREALAGVKWTQGQRWYSYTLDMYERDLGPDGRRIRQERTWAKKGASETPFRSLPAESLAAAGYIVGDDISGRTFYAPDANVLLGDTFLETHCFTAREGKGADSGFVGLAFTPAPGRGLPDIRGVLWVSRRTARLRNLVYRYVNVPYGLPENQSGGHLDFMRLQNGAWIVLRWAIRMPIMTKTVDPAGRITPRFSLDGYHEIGGQVSSIRSPSGALVYSGEQAVLDGTVVDSTRGGRPLAGATVWLQGTPYHVEADSTGHFELSAPIEGSYGAVFTHPRLDSLGGLVPPRAVTLTRGSRATVTLAVPPEPQILGELCPEGLADSERVIVGQVIEKRNRAPAAGAAVHATWQVFGAGGGLVTVQPWTASVTTDSAGRYVLCGVPATKITLRADSGGAKSSPVTLRFGSGGVWIDQRLFRSLSGQIWMADLALVP